MEADWTETCGGRWTTAVWKLTGLRYVEAELIGLRHMEAVWKLIGLRHVEYEWTEACESRVDCGI